MLNIYEKRWNKAKELALNLIRLKKEAMKKYGKNIIFINPDIEDGEPITGEIIIGENTIYIQDKDYIKGLFVNDPKFDDGSHTKIKDIEKQFNKFKIYAPYEG